MSACSAENSNIDVLVIGSGPAGCTSSIYAARAGRKTCIITGAQQGGQLMITSSIENFPGFEEPISGPELMDRMMKQSEAMGVEIVCDTVSEIEFRTVNYASKNSNRVFRCICESGNIYASRSIIIATGASAKWLGVPGEVEYRGRGVSACATCDGFFFRNKDVVVVGGGNVAVEDALFLANFANSVTLVHRRDQLRAEKIMQQRLFQNPKINVLWNTVVKEIEGDDNKVTGLKLINTTTNDIAQKSIDGVFVAIGHQPNTAFLKGQINLDSAGYIATTSSLHTNIDGVFAAGDVCDPIYRQAVTSAGQGCIAAIEADKFLGELLS